MLITEDDARTAPFDDRCGRLPADPQPDPPADPPADPLGLPMTCTFTRPEEDVPC